MALPDIYILVEGEYDEDFVRAIILPYFESRGKFVKIVKYRRKKEKEVRKLINFIYKQNKTCIFLADINNAPCVTFKIDWLLKEKKYTVKKEDITIVIKEIESWYFAGLSHNKREELGINDYIDVNSLTKEKLPELRPQDFDSDLDFMLSILENYSISNAVNENKSFAYFCNKYALTSPD